MFLEQDFSSTAPPVGLSHEQCGVGFVDALTRMQESQSGPERPNYSPVASPLVGWARAGDDVIVHLWLRLTSLKDGGPERLLRFQRDGLRSTHPTLERPWAQVFFEPIFADGDPVEPKWGETSFVHFGGGMPTLMG